jgi:hypothetical protein
MHSENIKVLQHPIIGNVQVRLQQHPQIASTLNNLQLIASSPGQNLVLTSSSNLGLSSFYVSFRLASILPSTHSWGAYVAQSDISSVEQGLIANGCSQADAHRIAEETIYSMLAFQFLFDCELLHLHEIFFITGHGFQADSVFAQLLWHTGPAGDIGVSFAGENLRSEFGINSTQSAAIKQLNLPCYYRRGEFAAFSRYVFGNLLTQRIIFSNPFALDQFLKTIPIYTNPKRAFPGVSLPVNRF